ncbi:MAG: methylmalonyl-CoA mutase family protein [Bacteroidia bacterium]|nr:methylmalonyl-CoA mutase family protein [Bacteroidia bacterium]
MKLFEEFSPTSAQQWEEKILKDLKIHSISELIWHTPEHIDIRPFYNNEHLSHWSVQPAFFQNDYEIVQYVPAYQHSSEEINENIIKSLNGGASGIYLEFYKQYNFAECFNNISLPHIYSNIHLSFDALDALYTFKGTYLSNNEYTQKKQCYFNIDPIFLFEKFGEWHHNIEADFEILTELNHIPVNAVLYKESGANAVQELAYTLAHLNEYLLYLEKIKKISEYQYIHIHVSVGNSFFTEIAKLRALRILVNHLLNEYHQSSSVHIHAQTTLVNKSYFDIYNNLIRTTTESMSAILGGANSISSMPFDFPFKKISDFTLRMARNQLIIMKFESFLNRPSETALGSFYIENYTRQLVDAAYQKFLSIEKEGGLLQLLEKNSIQDEIQQSFESQMKQYIENKEVLIGVNKYLKDNQEIQNELYYKMNVASSHKDVKPLHYRRFAEYFEHQKQIV